MHTKGELPVQGALPKQQHPREGQVFSWLVGYYAVRGLSYGITGNKHVSPKGFAGFLAMQLNNLKPFFPVVKGVFSQITEQAFNKRSKIKS